MASPSRVCAFSRTRRASISRCHVARSAGRARSGSLRWCGRATGTRCGTRSALTRQVRACPRERDRQDVARLIELESVPRRTGGRSPPRRRAATTRSGASKSIGRRIHTQHAAHPPLRSPDGRSQWSAATVGGGRSAGCAPGRASTPGIKPAPASRPVKSVYTRSSVIIPSSSRSITLTPGNATGSPRAGQPGTSPRWVAVTNHSKVTVPAPSGDLANREVEVRHRVEVQLDLPGHGLPAHRPGLGQDQLLPSAVHGVERARPVAGRERSRPRSDRRRNPWISPPIVSSPGVRLVRWPGEVNEGTDASVLGVTARGGVGWRRICSLCVTACVPGTCAVTRRRLGAADCAGTVRADPSVPGVTPPS